MSRKKVIHIINSLLPGGAEILLANTLSTKGLQQFTDNVLVYFQESSTLEKIIDPSVKVICLNYQGLSGLPGLLVKLKKIITKEKADIVHTHLTPAGLYTRMSLPAGVKQVHTLHTTFSIDKETRAIFKWADKHLFFAKKSANIICLSEYTKQDFVDHIRPKGKVYVLNNFVEDRYFDANTDKNYQPGQPLKLVATGTIKPLKNYEYLLDVFAKLKNIDVSLDIYGRGNSEEMQQRIDKEGLKINFKGAVEDTSIILTNYDLFVLPSKFEGFPLSVFEAMAMGLPVLSSEIPPLTSILQDNAFYFPLNDPDITATIISNIQSGKISIRELAKKSSALAEKLVRKELFLKRLLSIYDDL